MLVARTACDLVRAPMVIASADSVRNHDAIPQHAAAIRLIGREKDDPWKEHRRSLRGDSNYMFKVRAPKSQINNTDPSRAKKRHLGSVLAFRGVLVGNGTVNLRN
ncbi:hypothetical protein PR202_ga31562 [Eleusine coracana subsp. coracana]|uniref:Uncharacterized protein n=1 Tax=Eleusine coracana subsp. coracana TaxID=191504 RepID=A0AAV5DS69_ELECO|nr:hypothetical protein PR202_ga31562 [Eleusine coracana subsp. coracana]